MRDAKFKIKCRDCGYNYKGTYYSRCPKCNSNDVKVIKQNK